MDIHQQLFEGERITFGPIDHENDPEIVSRWTHDSAYLRLLGAEMARPRSPAQMKKIYEALEKEAEEGGRLFYFTIRTCPAGSEPARLIGFAKVHWIEFAHGTAFLELGIGEPEYRGKGYGTEALKLLLRFAFEELNLYRVGAMIPEYNEPALKLFKKAGFVEEVRRRQAVHRDGRRWDIIHLGLLREEV